MGILSESIVSLVLVAAAVILLVKLLLKPMKWIFKLLLNTGLGFVLLFIVNFVGSWVNISIAMTWLNALIVGGVLTWVYTGSGQAVSYWLIAGQLFLEELAVCYVLGLPLLLFFQKHRDRFFPE